jgi:hypothetical protein
MSRTATLLKDIKLGNAPCVGDDDVLYTHLKKGWVCVVNYEGDEDCDISFPDRFLGAIFYVAYEALDFSNRVQEEPVIDDRPIEAFTTENWMIAKVVGEDDYRFGAYVQETDERTLWTIEEQDLSCSLEELQELYHLIGSVLDGLPGVIHGD